MIRVIVICVVFYLSLFQINAQTLHNTANRQHQSLDGQWKYIADPYENGYYNYRYEPFDQQENPGSGAFFLNSKASDKTDLVEYDFDKSESIQVPGDWNTQDERLFYYEGTIWYKKSFDYTKKEKENRIFLYFGAVNYQAEVYLNGSKLGAHIGGFTPFNFEVTDLLRAEDNFLIVKVDNKRLKDGVPTLNTDWWNYGGITRSVKLIETPAIYIQDYLIQLEPDENDLITGYVQLNGNDLMDRGIMVSLPEFGYKQIISTNEKGLVSIHLKLDNIHLWTPENPRLYEVKIQTTQDTISDKIGFRTISTQGSKVMLNGDPVFLRGICIHEERPGGGRVTTLEDAKQLLSWAKDLGCNYVRLAHYPHNEQMVRLADEMGILVWEEIPVYWTIDWENESTYKNAENQLTEVITRDKNRASVIIWSMANETPTSEVRFAFLSRLAAHSRKLDPTRLISAALEQSNYKGNPMIRTIDDPFADVVDILSFNQYIGWYEGLPEKCSQISWKIDQDKPVMISEFGAGAKAGYHADSLTRWSEEYQEYLYRETLEMINKIPQLSGFSPWILMDFRSPRRPLPEIQDYWNRKGLISEKGEKKLAFYELQKFYQSKMSMED